MIQIGRAGAVALLTMTVGMADSALGAEPTPLGVFTDWTAYAYKASDTRVCYIVSQPKSSEAAKKVKRDPIFFIITHMPGRNINGEVSTIIGYPFKEATTVQLKVDNVEFELFTNGDGAWADTTEKEKKIVATMKAGQKFSVRGTSWKGTETTDNYSLNGFSAAMDKIDSSCR
ncbi:MAG TPA: invasion associated locus B family protein [Aestuariivirga sp.]|nr:invasion associated locus B family protein [Aestuariivirga sp.]